MATLLDSFIVSLAVDAQGVVRGVQDGTGAIRLFEKAATESGKAIETHEKKTTEASKKGTKALKEKGKEAESAGKKGADAFSLFRKEALAAFAILTGGRSLKAFVSDVSSANLEMGNLHSSISNIPISKLTQIGAAVESIGGSRGEAGSFLSGLQDRGSTAEGRAQLNQTGIKLGIGQVVGNDGNPRADIFEAIANSPVFKQMSSNVQRAYLSELGASEGIKNLLTNPNFNRQFNQFAGHGPNQRDINRSQGFRNSTERASLSIEDKERQVFTGIEPALEKVTDAFTKLINSHPEALAKGIDGISNALDTLASVLGSETLTKVVSWLFDTIANSPLIKAIEGTGKYFSTAEDYNKGKISGKDALKQVGNFLLGDTKAVGAEVAQEVIDKPLNFIHSTNQAIDGISDSVGGGYDTQVSSQISSATSNDSRTIHIGKIEIGHIPDGGDPKVIAGSIAKELSIQFDMTAGGGLR